MSFLECFLPVNFKREYTVINKHNRHGKTLVSINNPKLPSEKFKDEKRRSMNDR
jgi:hypothetical protein